MGKDYGIKLGTKDQVYWTSVKQMTEMSLSRLIEQLRKLRIEEEDCEKAIKLNKGIVEYAESKVKTEKEKMRKMTIK